MTATVVRKARALPRRSRALAVAATDAVRDRVRAESRRRRTAWVAITLLLTLGPLSFNLAREADFKASVILFPRTVGPYPATYDPEVYRAFLADSHLREQMRLNAGPETPDYRDDVTVSSGPDDVTLTLTVVADTPRKAQRFVNALAPQFSGATTRRLAEAAEREIPRVRAQLRVAGADRAALRRRLRQLEGLGEFPPPAVLAGRLAPLPRIERPADRLVDSLPGDFRGRPQPLWSLLAGLLVSLILWGCGLLLAPPRVARD